MADSLGRLVAVGHQKWEWRYSSELNTLFRMMDEGVIAYPQTSQTRYTDTPNRYSPVEECASPQSGGLEDVASVPNIAPDMWSVVSYAPQQESNLRPTDFREVLYGWEHTWLWGDFR